MTPQQNRLPALVLAVAVSAGAEFSDKHSFRDASNNGAPNQTTVHTMPSPEENATWLVKCLEYERRDDVLSAAEYLAMAGAARLYDRETDSHAQWRKVGDGYLAWLEKRRRTELLKLEEGFCDHLSTRSPCYLD